MLSMQLYVWHRLLEHAADTFSIFKFGTDGVTSYKRINSRDVNVPIAAFGENVYYHVASTVMKDKVEVDPAWHDGM